MRTRLFLGLTGLLFLAFAAVSLINPIGMAAALGVFVSGPNGAYELRGIYGGVSLGAGLLCLGGVLRASLRTPALWFLAAYMGGYIFARAAALLMGPAPTPAYIGFIAFEVVVFLGAALCLLARRHI